MKNLFSANKAADLLERDRATLVRALRRDGVQLRLGAKLSRVEQQDGDKVLHLEGGAYVEHAHVTGDETYEATQPFPVTVVPARLAAG